jgi:ABC-type multidrug transport system fused ATPase/permease subunit
MNNPSGGQITRIVLSRALYSLLYDLIYGNGSSDSSSNNNNSNNNNNNSKHVLIVDDILGSLDTKLHKEVWSGLISLRDKYNFGILYVDDRYYGGSDYIVTVDNTANTTVTIEEGKGAHVNNAVTAHDTAAADADADDAATASASATAAAAATAAALVDTTTQQKLPLPATRQPTRQPPPSLPLKSYISYFSRSNPLPLLLLTLLVYSLSNVFTLQQHSLISSASSIARREFNKKLLAATGAISLTQIMKTLLTLTIGLRSSNKTFMNMVKSLRNKPLQYFNNKSIISTFVNDMSITTTMFPEAVMWSFTCIASVTFSGIFILKLLKSPYIFFIVLAIGKYYTNYVKLYRPSQRRLKLQESITRSPIINTHYDAIAGYENINTDRVLKKEYEKIYEQQILRNGKVNWSIKTSDRWLSIRLETLGNLFVLACGLSSILASKTVGSNGRTGIVISQALGMVGLCNWSVRCVMDVEQTRVNVARCESLEMRSADVAALAAPDKVHAEVSDWGGDIQFNGVSANYTKTDEILSNVNLSLPGGKRIGICGRSGSGKSTLVNSLLGLMEVTAGTISIAGVPTADAGGDRVRQNICFVNQGNGVFPGTLRYNLLCDDEANDDIAWKAIRLTSRRLHDKLRFFGDKALGMKMADIGLSEGEKVIIQVARAVAAKLLNPTGVKILVMDEATATVDYNTGEEIKKVVDEVFADCTRIIISHQLSHIKRCDYVVVMGDGRVIEAAPPDANVVFQSLIGTGRDTLD